MKKLIPIPLLSFFAIVLGSDQSRPPIHVFIECTLPSEDALKKIICHGRENFCETTNLPKTLTRRDSWCPLAILNMVTNAHTDYMRKLRTAETLSQYCKLNPHDDEKIIKDILENCTCSWIAPASTDDAMEDLIGTGRFHNFTNDYVPRKLDDHK